jgi:shikimate dehydrogenase
VSTTQPSSLSNFELGLIGYPLSHSLSPKIQAAAFQSCGLEGDYSLFPIHPEDKQGLEDLLYRVRSTNLHGLNVTIPHKQNVIPFLDELTPTATAIGAVNTIYLRNDELIGDNTDAPGFLADVKRLIDSAAFSFQPSALVLGAGGSARAVVYALLNDGWRVILAARRVEQANELAKQFEEVNIMEFSLQTFQSSNLQLIVNTTPLGMTPNTDQSPWPKNLHFPTNAAIYDLVYNPRETKLVRDAHAQGLNAITGLGMLIEQAALAFEIWTNHIPSRESMHASVEQFPIPNHQSSATNDGVY